MWVTSFQCCLCKKRTDAVDQNGLNRHQHIEACTNTCDMSSQTSVTNIDYQNSDKIQNIIFFENCDFFEIVIIFVIIFASVTILIQKLTLQVFNFELTFLINDGHVNPVLLIVFMYLNKIFYLYYF